MVPYPIQWEGWVEGIAVAQHNGNVSRRELYATFDNPDSQSMSFFNQGKNLGSILSSTALFKCVMKGAMNDDPKKLLAIQVACVEGAFKPKEIATNKGSEEVYSRCGALAAAAAAHEGTFGYKQRLLSASKIIGALAHKETRNWVQSSLQDEQGTLPHLTIPNGGHPRSAGPRVEMLQPVFHQMIESEEYRALSEPV